MADIVTARAQSLVRRREGIDGPLNQAIREAPSLPSHRAKIPGKTPIPELARRLLYGAAEEVAMKNEAQSKSTIEQTQPMKVANSPVTQGTGTTVRPVRLNPVAIFSACVHADSSFRF